MRNTRKSLALIALLAISNLTSVSVKPENYLYPKNGEDLVAPRDENNVYLNITSIGLYEGRKGSAIEGSNLEYAVALNLGKGEKLPDASKVTSSSLKVSFLKWCYYVSGGMLNYTDKVVENVNLYQAVYKYNGDYTFPSSDILPTSSIIPPSTPPVTPSTPIIQPSTPPVTPSTPIIPPSTPPVTPSTPIIPPTTPPVTPSTPIIPPSTPPVTPSTPIIPPSTPPVTPSTPIIPPSTPPVTPSTPIIPPTTPPVTPSTPIIPPSTPPVVNERTYYFIDSAWWNSNQGDSFYYAFNSIDNSFSETFPGNLMTWVSERVDPDDSVFKKTWKFTVDINKFDTLVVSRMGKDGTGKYIYWGAKTDNINLTEEFNTIFLWNDPMWEGDGNLAKTSTGMVDYTV